MAVPVAQAGADQAYAYSSLPKLVTLSGGATNPPILDWEWRMLAVPDGSSANVGSNHDFTNGVSIFQNPQFTCDVAGCYVLQLRAQNIDGWSVASIDREEGQTAVFILTQIFGLKIPNTYLYRYDSSLNETLLDIEGLIAAHSSRHKNGGADEVATATAGANAIPKADSGGKLDTWISDAASGAKGLVQLTKDLGGSATAPTVAGLGGDALPSNSSNGFLKRNAGNTAWEEIAYGSGSNTVCQGNDGRLSDSRAPAAHASSHVTGSDQLSDAVGGITPVHGLLSTSDKTKLDGIESGADVTSAHAPKSHAASHQNSGGDEVATATAAANAIPKAGAGGKVDIGWLPTGTTVTDVCMGNDSRLSDSRAPTSHASSHITGGDQLADAVGGLTPVHGLMSTSDKTKLDGVESGADVTSAHAPKAHAASHATGSDQIADAIGGLTPVHGLMPASDKTKLDGVEAGADVTSAHAPKTHAASHVTGGGDTIADAIAAGNSGLMSGAMLTKLNGIEALADVTGSHAPQAHALSHKHSGGDEVATATPAANAIPKANSLGKLDVGWMPSSSGWVTILDTNFATEPGQTISPDGPYTIGGVVWTKYNSVNDNVNMVLTPGAGLVITPKQVTDLYTNTKTLPYIWLPLTSLIPTLSLHTRFRIWMMGSANYAAQYDGTILALARSDIYTAHVYKHLYTAGAINNYASYDRNGTEIGNRTVAGTQDCCMLESMGIGHVTTYVYYMNSVGGNFPLLNTLYPFARLFIDTISVEDPGNEVGLLSNWGILIGAQRSGSATALVATINRIKVEYLQGM